MPGISYYDDRWVVPIFTWHIPSICIWYPRHILNKQLHDRYRTNPSAITLGYAWYIDILWHTMVPLGIYLVYAWYVQTWLESTGIYHVYTMYTLGCNIPGICYVYASLWHDIYQGYFEKHEGAERPQALTEDKCGYLTHKTSWNALVPTLYATIACSTGSACSRHSRTLTCAACIGFASTAQ